MFHSACEAAPVLADQSDLLQSKMIQQLPEDEAMELVGVVISARVLVRLAKPYNAFSFSVNFFPSLQTPESLAAGPHCIVPLSLDSPSKLE